MIHEALYLPTLLALSAAAQGNACPAENSPELKSYIVRKIRIETPFDFSGQLRGQFNALKAELPQKQGQLYDNSLVTQGSKLIADLGGDSDFGQPVNLTVAVASIEACDTTGNQKSLDLLYSLFTSRISLYASGTPEAAAKESLDPIQGAGLDQMQRLALTPRLDYNRAAKTQLGATLDIRNLGVIDDLSLDARGSTDSGSVDAAAGGSLPLDLGSLRQLDWNASYHYADLPAGDERLRKSLANAQFSTLTKELGNSGILLRAGGAFERGNQDSAFEQTELPNDTLAEADYTGVKLFTGVSWRAQRQTLSLSYGLQLGSSGSGFSNGFRKHIFDAGYEIRFLPRDFTPQTIELRFSAGEIDNRGSLPVGERFFGGNVSTPFIAGEAWKINASPLIRSFAQNELARAGTHAAGGDRFASFNFTYAPTVWNIPLLPEELRNNEELEAGVNGQLNTAETTLGKIYGGRDPAIQQIQKMVTEHEQLKEQLTKVLEVFQAAENNDKGELEDRFFECSDDLGSVIENDIPAMSAGKPESAAVPIQAVLRPGGHLDSLRQCASDLRQILGPEIDTALTALQATESKLVAVYSKFDQKRAERLAKSDLVFTRRVLDRFFHEINIASVAPVLTLDAARIGPSVPGESDVRYGIGAGIRLTLVNSVRLTLAYAVNPHPHNDERNGALNFSLDFVDLFY